MGTTNSCACVMVHGDPVIIPNRLGNRLTPSVVRILETGKVEVGEPALRARHTDATNTITGIKRLIGRTFNEVADLVATLPYEVVVGSTNLAMVRAHGREYSPQVISGCILRSLRQSAEAFLGAPVTQAVITVPAYFTERQRAATREAGALAGFEVLRILTEPTAASFAYGLYRNHDVTIAVFDLGGGTFDISVLEMGEGVLEVKAVSGDGFVGGDDFDERISAWIVEETWSESGIDLSSQAATMEWVRSEAVRAKCELSFQRTAVVRVPAAAGKWLTLELTREKFEELCEELFERLLWPVQRVAEDCGWSSPGLWGARVSGPRQVLLVGGATRIPKVSEIVRASLGVEPSHSVNPDEAVGIGAGIQGGVLAGTVKDLLLLDATPLSLGVENAEGMMVTILPRNTTIPTRKSEVFIPAVRDQSSVEIHVLEGERELAINNRSLMRLVLDDISRDGMAEIEVTFDINFDGSLHIEAKDRATGRTRRERFTVTTGAGDESLPPE